ncbi:hypothetical protein AVEN_135628-1 [Araneus ventricosus]|uniref:Uncharacterized protein n=1 Tax=Araneus ventricosus TaxID=182803 RepID=A0A4Y2J3E2_ARAVE|nr:hypothetical protein AVEN_135628-1 [Araneus ventricosus]
MPSAASRWSLRTHVPNVFSSCVTNAVLQKESIIRWKKEWDNGETGRSVHNVLPKVKITPTTWQRPEIMFVTGHFRHISKDSTSEAAIPVAAAETWETPYTMTQVACLQHHTT